MLPRPTKCFLWQRVYNQNVYFKMKTFVLVTRVSKSGYNSLREERNRIPIVTAGFSSSLLSLRTGKPHQHKREQHIFALEIRDMTEKKIIDFLKKKTEYLAHWNQRGRKSKNTLNMNLWSLGQNIYTHSSWLEQEKKKQNIGWMLVVHTFNPRRQGQEDFWQWVAQSGIHNNILSRKTIFKHSGLKETFISYGVSID